MTAPTTEVKPRPKKHTPPPKPPKRPKAGPKVHGKDAVTVPTRVAKQFTIGPWRRAGRKIIVYAGSGMGKTTLAMLLDDPAFIGLDDGGGIMLHPVTGEKVMAVEGVEDYQDVKDAINSDIFDPHEEIVIDTITDVGRWQVPYMLGHTKKQGGGFAINLEDYGFHKGYRHWFEEMELFLNDLNRWVRKGKTVVLLAQSNAAKIHNDGGEDYMQVAPDLYHDKKHSILNLVTQWSDHIFRINYSNLIVEKKGDKVSTTNERAIFIHGRPEFMAKSRTIGPDWTSVEFEDKTDDSIWRLLKDPTGGE